MPPEALSLLGGGRVAYVKTIRYEDPQGQFLQAPQLAPGMLLYSPHAADVGRQVEGGHRPAKIVALGSAMSSFAIVVDPKSGIYEPEQLKNKPMR
jgi:hypothetical protein